MSLAVSSAEKPFISAIRIWISAVWLSGCLAAIPSPKAFKPTKAAVMRREPAHLLVQPDQQWTDTAGAGKLGKRGSDRQINRCGAIIVGSTLWHGQA